MGADMIVQILADEGVDTIFGYSGGAILPHDAVFRFNEENKDSDGNQPMPLIVPANEQGAGLAQDMRGQVARLVLHGCIRSWSNEYCNTDT